MIYKDGAKWEGWQENLRHWLGAKVDVVSRNGKFEVTDRYSGTKWMGDGTGGFVQTKTRAISVGIPVEFNWTDPNGSLSVIRYVTHVEKRVEQGKELHFEYPGSLYVREGKFDTRQNSKELFWFYMTSPFCENGFMYDVQWGKSEKEVRENRELRAQLGLHPKYKYVDEEVARRARLKLADDKFKAQQLLRDMSTKERMELYLSFGQPATELTDEVFEYLDAKAAQNPDSILKADKNSVSYLALVNSAEAASVIQYRKKAHSWHFPGEDEPIVFVTKGVNPTNYFVEWLKTKDDGQQVFTRIKEGMKQKQEEPVL